MDTLSERTRRRLLAIIGLLVAVLMVEFVAAQVQAADSQREFLTKAQVKSALSGVGTWDVATQAGSERPMGTSPGRCRSDLALGRAEEIRSANYWGPLPGPTPYVSASVVVELYKFGSRGEARAAVRKVSRWVPACPETLEWYCQNCDGSQEFYRSPAKRRRVGAQSYTWNERTAYFHGMANGRAIAARSGRIVVITRASHATDADGSGAPPAPPTWRAAVTLARQALAEATS